MENVEGFDFVALQFDKDGNIADQNPVNELKTAAGNATDVIFIAHGFRNSESEARDLYSEFLRNFRTNITTQPDLAPLKTRKFLVGGVFWPSKSLPESARDLVRGGGTVQSVGGAGTEADEKKKVKEQLQELREEATDAQKLRIDEALQLVDRLNEGPAVQDEFAAAVKSMLTGVQLEQNEGIDKFRSRTGTETLKRLKNPVILPASRGPAAGNIQALDDKGQVQGLSDVVQSIFGAAARFVNLTTWYLMKDRAGKVGANGTAQCVRAVKSANPAVKVHLVGHSLGGRLVAACAKALDSNSVASLNLLQAAFSHYGFSRSPAGAAGFFDDVLSKHVVKGPILATYSAQDSVVGLTYAIASRLAGDNVRAIGDEHDEYGGIGRNGTQLLQSARNEALHQAGKAYAALQAGGVTNLNGSGGLISSHGDVRSPAVTYAVASAIAST